MRYNGAGLRTSSAKRSGRCWVPISSRSAKPRVRKIAVGAPRRSSSALVPRVVASRSSTGGSGAAAGVPVTRRHASTGASSGLASSQSAPAPRPAGGAPSSSTTPPSSQARAPTASLPSRERRRQPGSGPGTSPVIPSTTRRRSPTAPVTRPRRQALDSTLTRRSGEPSGGTARQSVKVPPVSTQTRQGRAGPSELTRWPPRSVAEHLDQHPLRAPAVELAVEDLLPGTEVELAPRDGHHHLAPHHLALHVRVGVVLSRAVVAIALRRRVEGRQRLEPPRVVLVQPRLVVVDEDAGRDVHGVDQHDPLRDAAAAHRRLDLGGDVAEGHPGRDLESEVLGQR